MNSSTGYVDSKRINTDIDVELNSVTKWCLSTESVEVRYKGGDTDKEGNDAAKYCEYVLTRMLLSRVLWYN